MRRRDYPLFERLMSLYPEDIEKDVLDSYCRENLFENEYIFRNSRRYKDVDCRCTRCNSLWHEDKVGKTAKCQVCGIESPTKFSSRKPITERLKIGIFSNDKDGNLLLNVKTAERVMLFDTNKIDFYDYGYTLRLPEKTYCWRWKVNMGWGDFIRYDNSALFEDFKIFNPELLYDKYPAYDKQLFNGYKSFDYMLKNMDEQPITEYLIKCGFYNLASSSITSSKGKTLREILNINPNEIPVIRKANVTNDELSKLRNIKEYFSFDDLINLRKLNNIPYNLINKMGLKKYINYATKQLIKHNTRAIDTEYLLQDYWKFCKRLNIDTSKKSVKYPDNIRIAHDRLLAEINEIDRIEREKAEAERQKTLRQRQKIFKTRKKQFERNGLCIIVPETYEEFVVEGSSLNHCVGTGIGYFNRHMNGDTFICFIRQTNNMTKPYYTAEIDPYEFRIKQLYGFADCSAPAEIRQYVEKYIMYKMKKERKAA